MRLLGSFLRIWARLPSRVRWSGVFAEMGLLWFLSSRTPLVSAATNAGAMLHNAAHVVAYAALGAMALLAQTGTRASLPRQRWVAILMASVYGAVDELHQGYVPGRVQSLSDFGSDLCGALCGVLLVQSIRSGEPRWARLAWAALVGGIGCVTLATFTDW